MIGMYALILLIVFLFLVLVFGKPCRVSGLFGVSGFA